jgi:hypothetical protein
MKPRAGETVSVQVLDGAGHFELVDPGRHAFVAVRDAARALLGGTTRER